MLFRSVFTLLSGWSLIVMMLMGLMKFDGYRTRSSSAIVSTCAFTLSGCMQATRLPKSVDFLRAVCKQHSNYKQQKTINTSSDTSQSVNHRAVVKESGVHEHDTVLSFSLCGLGKRTATLADILRLHVSNLSRTINPHSFFRHCFQSETINTAVSTKEKF